MKRSIFILTALALLVTATAAFAAEQPKFIISGTTYMKYLWGNQHDDGSVYNFTTVPGEGYGDNGAGSEVELLLFAKPNKYVEVQGRLHSRFNQNQWTNFGGFGGTNPPENCQGGDCGEYDPRSNQYVKLRGVSVRLTPGYKFLDAATFGSTDLGMFDAYSIGKVRYIDRDNTGALLFQGPLGSSFKYDLIRISTPRLWAGPNFNTGQYAGQDSVYGFQVKYDGSQFFEIAAVAERARDIEIKTSDHNLDDGRDLDFRYKNDVYGVRFGIHPNEMVDIRGVAYTSSAESNTAYGAPGDFFGISGFSPVPAGKPEDQLFKVNLDVNDPFKNGLSFNMEYFNIGAEYSSLMAARREVDVLLTEGHDSTWAFPGPSNAAFGVFGGNPTRIGYNGWQGNAQQVATINVDNEFTDFDEPMAETVIGWKGFTIVPVWTKGDLQIAGEYTHVGYNTNWQAFGDSSRPILSSLFPVHELDTGVGHNFRSAYAPFQDKSTDIGLVRAKYTVNWGRGIELWGKVKFIDETDKRLNDARFLPYAAGDCPVGGSTCKGVKNFYSTGNSTADLYGNPGAVTVNGVTGYQWKPFDSISDDDRDLNYKMLQVGAGYQLSDNLYGSVTYEYYDADLKDGNTAFQAYQLHEMASGKHEKNKVITMFRYPIGGVECGLSYEYAFGTFRPDFGGGFVPQVADAAISASNNVPVGSLGFKGRFGGWNSLETRDFDHQNLKAYLKVRF